MGTNAGRNTFQLFSTRITLKAAQTDTRSKGDAQTHKYTNSGTQQKTDWQLNDHQSNAVGSLLIDKLELMWRRTKNSVRCEIPA